MAPNETHYTLIVYILMALNYSNMSGFRSLHTLLPLHYHGQSFVLVEVAICQLTKIAHANFLVDGMLISCINYPKGPVEMQGTRVGGVILTTWKCSDLRKLLQLAS